MPAEMKRSKLVSLKNNLLAFLLYALVLPPIIAFSGAAFVHLNQERAMEAAVSFYAQDLAENIAYRLGTGARDPRRRYSHYFSIPASRYSIFSMGPSIPGWVAYVDPMWQTIMSSPGAGGMAEVWQDGFPVGRALSVTSSEGRKYTIAAHPVRGSGYVIAAVSWTELLGNFVRIGRLWAVLISAFSLFSFLTIRLLWRRLIFPLKTLASEIDDLSLGKDLPKDVDPRAIWEIKRLHSALARFAQAAIDRDNLRNCYVRDIVRVQEAERLDMAREIHDGPLQDITALLQQVHMTVEEGGYNRERINRAEQLAKVVVRELRGLCDELSPPWVDLGLSQALTELAERLSQNYDVNVSVDIDDSIELPEELTLSLLRIFQEAVSNAVRHGDATEIHASMRENEEKRFVFEVRDNGKGFDTEFDHQALRLEGHRGLANMTERMFLMGGTFEVRSVKGEGTTIICTLG